MRDGPGRLLILGCLLLPLWAFASTPEARAPLDPPATPGFRLPALQFAAGAGAALVSVPASLALSIWLGSLSNGLVLAALPAVLTFVALPPLAVTFAAAWLGNQLWPGSSTFGLPYAAAAGAQVLVLVGAILLGAHGANLADAAVLTLVEMLVLPAAAVGTMRLRAPAPIAPPARALAKDPSRPQRAPVPSLPVVSWAF